MKYDMIRIEQRQSTIGRSDEEVADSLVKYIARSIVEYGFLRFHKKESTMYAVLDLADDKLRISLACAFGDRLINPYGGRNPMDLSMKELDVVGKEKEQEGVSE